MNRAERITRAVCEVTGIPRGEIFGKSTAPLLEARSAIYFMLRFEEGWSVNAISEFVLKDNSAVKGGLPEGDDFETAWHKLPKRVAEIVLDSHRKMQRKITQLSSTATQLYALCDDGTCWYRYRDEWHRIETP